MLRLRYIVPATTIFIISVAACTSEPTAPTLTPAGATMDATGYGLGSGNKNDTTSTTNTTTATIDGTVAASGYGLGSGN